VRRRTLLALLGGAAAAWPSPGRTQQSQRTRRVGVLMTIAERDPESAARVVAFREGLRELGWIDGDNIRIEWRWSAGEAGRVRDNAAELVGSAPDLLVAGGTAGLTALQQATATIPIVFLIVFDPLGQGLVPSLAHPGGNITGFSFLDYPMLGKSLEMLKEVAPGLGRVALMFNPDATPYYAAYLRSTEADPHALPVAVTGAPVRSDVEIEDVIAGLGAAASSGLMVPPHPFTIVHRGAIMAATRRHGVPAIYAYREFVKEGGLMSYGPDTADIYRRSASYVDRILKGASPADLPVQAPTKFEMAVNLDTARAIGLTIPPSLLARADEVIE